MKVLTVRQQWASLIVAGIKTIETRPAPPNGPMRPPGVRGLPGLSIEPGERIGIHAAAARPALGMVGEWLVRWRWGECSIQRHVPGESSYETIWLPLGALIGTVEVREVFPIVDDQLPIVDSQLPLGDFTPGRWAWILAEPEPCDPQPMQGRQGVWEAAP